MSIEESPNKQSVLLWVQRIYLYDDGGNYSLWFILMCLWSSSCVFTSQCLITWNGMINHSDNSIKSSIFLNKKTFILRWTTFSHQCQESFKSSMSIEFSHERSWLTTVLCESLVINEELTNLNPIYSHVTEYPKVLCQALSSCL